MKTHIIISMILLINGLVISSCVSSHKYTEAQNENENYRNELESMNTRNQKLIKTRDSLAMQIVNIQNQLQQQLQQKEKVLEQDQQKIYKDQQMLSNLQKSVKMEQNEISNIRQEVCSALKCFLPDELSIKEKNGELYVSMYDKLLFPSGSAVVNKRGTEALSMLSDVLRKNNMEIMVEGHTDDVPINNILYKDNWDLSVARATSVTRVLIKDSIAPERVIASGRSQYHPYESNTSEKGRKLNRRTDIVIVPKLEELYTLINQNNNLQLEEITNR